MEELQKTKQEIRDDVAKKLDALSENASAENTREIENKLFEFANFLEANIVLLYINKPYEISTENILSQIYGFKKIVVLPGFDTAKREMKLMKVDHPETELIPGPRNIMEPDENQCKLVPIESVDIAIVPGIAFDEKGGRIGSGEGYYDRLLPKLSITTRKVALAFEDQIVPQIPVESHDKPVDIIITEKRIIYKI